MKSNEATTSLTWRGPRESNQREGHPAWRLPPIRQPLLRCLHSGIHALAMGGKYVSRGRAFRPDSCPGEKASTSLSMPAARPVAPASPPHRGPGRAAGHRDPHSVRNRCAVARAQELRASDVQPRVWSGIARAVCHRPQADVAPSAFRVSTVLASKNLDHFSVLVEKVHFRLSVRRHFQQDPLVAEGVHESEC